MNLVFQNLLTEDFRYNVKFLEKKRNMIMDGDFVKLVYSDECMAINSIYFTCTLKCKNEDCRDTRQDEKCMIWFAPYDPVNKREIEKIVKYEQILIEEYIEQMHCRKSPMFLLKNQLLSGNMRLYKMHHVQQPPTTMVVKISGIWESNEHFGITYKFLECTAAT